MQLINAASRYPNLHGQSDETGHWIAEVNLERSEKGPKLSLDFDLFATYLPTLLLSGHSL